MLLLLDPDLRNKGASMPHLLLFCIVDYIQDVSMEKSNTFLKLTKYKYNLNNMSKQVTFESKIVAGNCIKEMKIIYIINLEIIKQASL